MKILFNPVIFKRENTQNRNAKAENNIKNNSNITNLSDFPNYNYLINFGANNDSLETLYNNYGNGQGMPVTYDLLLSSMSTPERANIKEVFAHYRSVYDDMENCHTVEDLKEKFPQEFANLKSALSIQARTNSFLNKFNDLSVSHSQDGEYIFPETQDNDLTVYLAKKIYLESKTKKEIDNDFYNDLSKIVYSKEDYQQEFPLENGSIIPLNIYKELGLTSSKNANGFRHSLCCSRQDYIQKYGSVYKSKRKETFNNFLETIVSVDKPDKRRIPQKNSANYEKYRYAMFLAWNNSVELRQAMSNYLIQNKSGNELLTPDIISINSSSNEEKLPLQSMMRGFWQRNPELRKQFSTTCSSAFEKIEEAIDTGTFEEFKTEIDAERIRIYEVLSAQKATKELEILNIRLEQERITKLNEKKKALRQDCIKDLHDFEIIRPVPKHLFSQTLDKIQSLLPEVTDNTSVTLMTLIRETVFLDIKPKIGDALCDTYFSYLKVQDNKSIDKRTALRILKFFSRSTDKLLEMPEYKALSGNKAMTDEALKSELYHVIKLFLTDIINSYTLYISKHKKENMKKPKIEKMIDMLHDEVTATEKYNKTCNTELRQFIFEELVGILKEIEPNEFLNKYAYFYKKRVLEDSNL